MRTIKGCDKDTDQTFLDLIFFRNYFLEEKVVQGASEMVTYSSDSTPNSRHFSLNISFTYLHLFSTLQFWFKIIYSFIGNICGRLLLKELIR